MIVDIECPRCRGEGWLLQRAPRLGPGLYEVTCEHCNGHGAVAVDAEDEVEDWMRDECGKRKIVVSVRKDSNRASR